jgi:hypothetical protein
VKRQLPQIVSIQGNDIERVELDLVIVLPAVQPVKVGDAINAKEDCLAIKDKPRGSDATGGLDNEGVSACPVVTVAGE